MVSLVDLVTEEEEEAQAAHPIMLDPLVECVRAQTIECVNEVCMALAKYLRQKKNWPLSSLQSFPRPLFCQRRFTSVAFSPSFHLKSDLNL